MPSENTLGNLIKKCDACLSDVPVSCYPIYAKMFKGTLIEKVIFTGASFEEAASEHCRSIGWTEPA
mgnify:CR=1 FL=1